MNMHSIFKILLGVAAVATVAGAITLVAAVTMPRQPGSALPNPLRSSSTDARYLRIHTVEHDGHLIIAMAQGSIMHHPDCPCAKQNEGTTLK